MRSIGIIILAAMLSAPAFAQQAEADADFGTATFNLIEPTPTLDVEEDLVFGAIILPSSSSSGNLEMTCGSNGTPTVTVPSTSRDAIVSDNQCAAIEITPSSAGQNIVITFGGGAVFTLDQGATTLGTTFTLYDSTGVAIAGLNSFDPTGAASSADSAITFSGTAAKNFYIGATAAGISSATPVGDYVAMFEVSVAAE